MWHSTSVCAVAGTLTVHTGDSHICEGMLCARACVFLYLLHVDDQNTHLFYLQGEDNFGKWGYLSWFSQLQGTVFKPWFEVWGWNWVKVRVRVRVKVMTLFGIVRVRVGAEYIYTKVFRKAEVQGCVCVWGGVLVSGSWLWVRWGLVEFGLLPLCFTLSLTLLSISF